MGLSDWLGQGECRGCVRLRQELQALREAERLRSFVSPALAAALPSPATPVTAGGPVADPVPSVASAVAIAAGGGAAVAPGPEREGCVLLCRYRFAPAPDQVEPGVVLQALDDFYRLVARAVIPCGGSIDRFHHFDVLVFFFAGDFQASCYQAAAKILRAAAAELWGRGLLVAVGRGRFLSGTVGEPATRLDHPTVGPALFALERLVGELPCPAGHLVLVPAAEGEAFARSNPGLREVEAGAPAHGLAARCFQI